MSDAYNGTFSFGRNRAWVAQHSSGFGVVHERSAVGRPVSLKTTLSDGTLLTTDLVRDSAGRIVAASDASGDRTFAYDVSGRLIEESYPLGSATPDVQYSYNLAGDRVEWTGHPVTEVAYDAAGRIVQDAVYSYGYDASGRRTAREDRATGDVTTYSWNALDQLVRVTDPAGRVTEILYDGAGRRIELVEDGLPVRFLHDVQLRGLLDENNELLEWVTTDPKGRILASYNAVTAESRYAITDEQGTPEAWVGPDGAVEPVAATRFGVPSAPSGAVELHFLTHHTLDPTGLIHAQARYLDPATGQFLSEDPIAAPNLYSYALGDPVNRWDPDGRTAEAYGTEAALITVLLVKISEAVTAPAVCTLTQAAAGVAAVGAVATAGYVYVELDEECGVETTKPDDDSGPEPEDPPPVPRPDPCVEHPALCDFDDNEPDCYEHHPYAIECTDPRSIDDVVGEFVIIQGLDPTLLESCRPIDQLTAPGEIDACSGSVAQRFHCDIDSETISIFACLCCEPDGGSAWQYEGPHFSPGEF